MKAFQIASEWIWRLMLTNFLWIGYTLIGIGVFGFMPATVSLFTVTRRWIKGDTEFSVWQVFKETYKKEWMNSNKAGLIFALIATFLFIDLRIANYMQGLFSVFLYIFFVFLFFVLFMTVIFFFPLYVQYTFSMKEYIKQSFFHSIVSIKDTLVIILGLLFIAYIFKQWPGLLLFMGGVIPSLWISFICKTRFKKLEEENR
ncbi:YesL family protein [Bacillus kwashiorkori]|uniref:YesL family protein n=1 Tax=Bacillus kwashiorkori TaxID=1522318 RepID=UPI00078422C2|nr:YesL family protein [Bacillus kwashiorkori]